MENLEEIETWRPIPSNPRYEVSNHGAIRIAVDSRYKSKGDSVALKTDDHGYISFSQSDPGTGKGVQMLVHRAVMEAFVGPCPTGLVVNHKDFNKQRNWVSNLEYTTRKENEDHAYAGGHKQNSDETRRHLSAVSPTRRLTEEGVLQIRALAAGGIHLADIAAQYCIKESHVYAICVGAKWGWLKEGIFKPDRRLRGSMNPSAKLIESDIIEIRRLYDSGLSGPTALAKQFSVGTSTIHRIIKRTCWGGVERVENDQS